MWNGRKHWIRALALALGTDRGRALVRRHHTSADTVLKVAAVQAKYASSRTGRQVTAAAAKIGAQADNVNADTVGRTRRVLRELGFAVEMARGRNFLNANERRAAHIHHGGRQTSAASVWHLTLPRDAVTAPERPLSPRRSSASLGRLARGAHAAAAVSAGHSHNENRDDLSSTTSVVEESSVGKKSPTRAIRARGGKKNSSKKAKNARKSGQDPQPLHRQQAAAELVAYCRGMDQGQWLRTGPQQYMRRHGGWHIGAVVEALADAGIDTEQVNGHDIARALTHLTIERGLTWPDNIRNPIGFLRSLLARLTKSGRVLTGTGRRRIHHEKPCTEHPHSARRADGECGGCFGDRMAAKTAPESPVADPGAHVLRPRFIRPSTAQTALLSGNCGGVSTRSHSMDLASNPDGLCTACMTAPGVLREQLLIPTTVCDGCWSTVDPATLNQDDAAPIYDDGLDELAAAAGDACTMCATAPGTVRESLSSKSVVCDGCWDSLGMSSYVTRRSAMSNCRV
ncbi:hypothetical protein ACIBJI_39925 [Nocardia sp. NPDC050408]|uniref:hypothetical protein n=1 Tax=Nocardia sp. NPDC050408 TaxID=3364319 RepID=UPI0037BDB770